MYVFFILALLSSSAWAQANQAINLSTDQLAGELAGLKTSTERLSAGNAALSVSNNALQSRLVPLQGPLQKLMDENNALTRSALKLQEVNPARARKIAELEKEAFDIDNKIEKLAEDINASRALIEGASKEDVRLNQRLKELGLSVPVAVPPPASVDTAQAQAKEKLRLLKMIGDSKQHQEDLYGKIAEAQKQRTKTVVRVETSSEKEVMLNQIVVLQEQVDQLKKTAAAPSDTGIDSEQFSQLQAQVKALQKNHDELESLANRMQQKARKLPLTDDQRTEQNRLRSTLAEIEQEAHRMKAELNSLRRQMVLLDKRKTSLEAPNP